MCSAGGQDARRAEQTASASCVHRALHFSVVQISSAQWINFRALMSWPDAAFRAWGRTEVSLACGGSRDGLFHVLVNARTLLGPAERLLLPTRRLGAAASAAVGCV